MNRIEHCPKQNEIEELVHRALPDEEAERLARHLEQCHECATTVENLLRGDTMADALRQASGSAGPVPGAAELIERLRSLWQAPVSESADAPTLSPAASQPGDATAGAPAVPAAGLDFLSPPRASDELGWLGSFRILKELGAGGMGMVFLAEDTKLERLVALKVMRPELARPEQKQRFLREARAAAKVQHDHVVTIYQVGEEGQVPFLAMQLLEGESLDDWLRRGEKASPAMICRIGREVAEGLAAAHARSLIHRDIKPGNLWLERNDERRMLNDERKTSEGDDCRPSFIIQRSSFARVKILDFGLARATSGQEQLTTPGTIIGTPAYAAPEQFRGEAEVRSDLFSLGAVLYRLCTGRNPFHGKDVLSLVASVSLDTPVAIRDRNPAIPHALADLINQLLAKEAKDRPATAREVAERLARIERAIVGEPGMDVARKSNSGPEARTELDFRATAAPGASRRSKQVAMLAALAACAALVLGAVIYVHTDRGTLEIRTSDPNVKVTIERDGEQIDILDPQSKQQLTIRSGKYTLKLAGGDDGLELTTDQGDNPVTLRRGGKVIVQVLRKPSESRVARSSFAPLDQSWVKKVQALSPAKQLKEVFAELRRRNPAFDPEKTWTHHKVENGEVTELRFLTDDVADISPVRGLPGLRRLYCYGSEGQKGKNADLSPLTGMKLTALICGYSQVSDLSPLKGMPLEELHCNHSKVADLRPLKGMPLKKLDCRFTLGIDDLTPLRGMKLTYLDCNTTSVSDLTPLKGMNLTFLSCGGTRVTDLSPITGMPLKEIWPPDWTSKQAAEILRSVKSLDKINGKPAAAVLAGLSKPFPPLDPAWVKKVQSLPPAEQVKEVAAELKRRNPGFDGKLQPQLWGPNVVGLAVISDAVTDLTPLQVLSELKNLNCSASRVDAHSAGLAKLADLSPLAGLKKLRQLVVINTQVVDLTPVRQMSVLVDLNCNGSLVRDLSALKGMSLEKLNCGRTRIADLSPLKGMPLVSLGCDGTGVNDVSPLAGMKLEALNCASSEIANLAPLRGMPLNSLWFDNTKVTDVSPVQAMPLKDLACDEAFLRNGDWVKSFKDLQRINGRPAKDVLAGLARPLLPLDVAWVKKVQSLTAEEQVMEVAAELKRRNPSFDPRAVEPAIGGGQVISIVMRTDAVADLSPMLALPKLKNLRFTGTAPRKGILADLTPLRGLKDLQRLVVNNNLVAELSSLRGMSLTSFDCSGTLVKDLTPLNGMPLHHLSCAETEVADLTPVRGMSLTQLHCYNSRVSDLTPLKEMPLKVVLINGSLVKDLSPLRGAPIELLAVGNEAFAGNLEVLKSLKNLKTINERPAAEVLAAVGKALPPDTTFFNGKDLTGWIGDPEVWRVENGAIIGQSPAGRKVASTFLRTVKKYTDFEMSFQVELTNPKQDTGVQIRSRPNPAEPFEVYGPQCSLGFGHHWGGVYDVGPKAGAAYWLRHPDRQKALATRKDGPNDVVIRCVGKRVTVTLNGTVVGDGEVKLPAEGVITFQWNEEFGAKKVIFRNIRFTDLSRVTEKFPLLDPAWIKKVQSLPPEEQVKEVAAELKRRNPGFDGTVTPGISDNSVSNLNFVVTAVTDLSPVRALPRLTSLVLAVPSKKRSELSDLSCLKDLKLKQLTMARNAVSDLSPLRGMPLTMVMCDETFVSDLSPLRGCKLSTFMCFETPVADLSPLEGMPLQILYFAKARVKDLSPLKSMPLLEGVICDFVPARDAATLRSIKTLKTINGKPVAEFWKQVDAEQAKFDEWATKVAQVPPGEQLARVVAELKRRNPQFDGKVQDHTFERGAVVMVTLKSAAITDISPLRALRQLQSLRCLPGEGERGALADLWPLRGMKLTTLEIANNAVRDLTPLRDVPLQVLTCDYEPSRDAAILRAIKSLQTFNGRPVKDVVK